MREPLVPSDVDLDGFDGFMIDIRRLRKSRFNTVQDDTAWRAGMNLWFSSWDQIPAGSLENDDASLCSAAGLGRDLATWDRVKAVALRGWIECTDGRLYHATVCETVLVAWIERLTARKQSGAGNAARWGTPDAAADLLGQIHEAIAALEALNPKADALKRFRRRYPAGNPNGSKEQGPEGGLHPKASEQRPNGQRQGSQVEAEAEGEGEAISLSPPKSPPASGAIWIERLALIRDKTPNIDLTSPQTANIAPLRKLVETDGIEWEDVLAAVIAIGQSVCTKSRPLYSFKHPAIADMAAANHELRTKGTTNGNGSRSQRNGSASRGLAGARDRLDAKRATGNGNDARKARRRLDAFDAELEQSEAAARRASDASD